MNKVIEFIKELGIVNLLVTIAVVFTNGIVSFFDEPMKISGYVLLITWSSILVIIVNLVCWIHKFLKPKQR